MRVFLDTNVLVSAFATRGLCADVVRVVFADPELITGEANLEELQRALRDRIKLPSPIIEAIRELLREQTVVPRPAGPASIAVRDQDDSVALASAEAVNADVLVTGDRDLLDVAQQSRIRIVSPRGFWELTRGGPALGK